MIAFEEFETNIEDMKTLLPCQTGHMGIDEQVATYNQCELLEVIRLVLEINTQLEFLQLVLRLWRLARVLYILERYENEREEA